MQPAVGRDGVLAIIDRRIRKVTELEFAAECEGQRWKRELLEATARELLAVHREIASLAVPPEYPSPVGHKIQKPDKSNPQEIVSISLDLGKNIHTFDGYTTISRWIIGGIARPVVPPTK